jgi:hypothetical protein
MLALVLVGGDSCARLKPATRSASCGWGCGGEGTNIGPGRGRGMRGGGLARADAVRWGRGAGEEDHALQAILSGDAGG